MLSGGTVCRHRRTYYESVCLPMNLGIGSYTTRRHRYSVHTKIAKPVQLLVLHLNVNRIGSSSISMALLLADDQAGLDRTHEMPNLPHGR